MNILFVNYGDFTSNSLNHIAGFADALTRKGHACIVAVPEAKASVKVILRRQFTPALFDELLDQPQAFLDGRGADVIHAWTPREVVRKFVLRYQAVAAEPARLIVHLEDNEQYLLESYTEVPFAELRARPQDELGRTLSDSLPHPLRHEAFLLAADGITYIVNALRRFISAQLPSLLLPPGVDFSLYRPQPASDALRRELGLADGEKVIAFTGSATFANQAEVRDLYTAVALLNARGCPTRLIRTGITPPDFLRAIPEEELRHVLHLGFVSKETLPKLLALSDVLVQPGRAGAFNDFRLPSKLPEFFAAGRPVILPETNLGRELIDGVDALLLRNGSAVEIADLCQKVFNDAVLAGRLGENAVHVARRLYDLEVNTGHLATFYEEIQARSPKTDWKKLQATGGSEISVLARQILDASGETLPEQKKKLELLELLVRGLENSLSEIGLGQVAEEQRRQLAHWKEQYDLTKQHIENLEKLLGATRKHVEKLHANLEKELARTQELSVEALLMKTEIARLDDRVLQMGIHQRDLVYQRDEKIRLIQESFSWKATSWLRALRRLLIDPRRRQPPAPAPLPPAPKHTFSKFASSFGQVSAPSSTGPSFRYFLDYPLLWDFRPAKLVLRGWCFAADGTKTSAIRARVGDRVYSAVVGLKRLDVMAALREYPQAEYCGFKIDVEFEAKDKLVILEAADETGYFQAFFRSEITVNEGGIGEKLTSYQTWVERCDTLSAAEKDRQRAIASQWEDRPLISILVPVYNTPEKWLRKAVESVLAQTYPNWELCLADDASPEAHVRPLLEALAASDARIKVVYRQKNGHISAASNSALEIATGAFIALLDHDDELAPDALFEVVSALHRHPNAELVYSDEDKIDEEGRRLEPYFKPDYLPDLYVGQNYISHLSVYRALAMRSVNGFRVGYEGSQDWDLALRVISRTEAVNVIHIPKVLYHWRAIPGSTALLISEKNYPLEAARRALTDHFERKQQAVTLTTVPGEHWRVKYPVPSPAPKVVLIIPTRDRAGLLRQCIESILEKTTYPNYEVVVVDNHSSEAETLAYFEHLSARGIRVLRYPGEFNYSAINNFAVAQTTSELVGLLNNDLEVIHSDWLDEMVSQASRPEIGCVGALLYYPNDHIQHAGVVLGIGGVAGHAFRDFPRGTAGVFNRARLVQNYSAVTAACLVVRRAIFEQVGGLDENELAVAFNDVDFCLKVRAAGYLNLWTPFAELYHHESASRGAEDTPEKHERFSREVETMLKRWPKEIEHDPAYNRNLTTELNDFSLSHFPKTISGKAPDPAPTHARSAIAKR